MDAIKRQILFRRRFLTERNWLKASSVDPGIYSRQKNAYSIDPWIYPIAGSTHWDAKI